MSIDSYFICEECGEELELADIKRYKYRDSFAYKIKPCPDCIQGAVNKALEEAQKRECEAKR